jgi:hypothetical protein
MVATTGFPIFLNETFAAAMMQNHCCTFKMISVNIASKRCHSPEPSNLPMLLAELPSITSTSVQFRMGMWPITCRHIETEIDNDLKLVF